MSVVGARPQFIKAAVLSEELARRGITEVLVHTGQHYDTTMSDVFFKELPIPKPTYELGVGSANHGAQTGMMMERLEPVVLEEKPDWLIVYGDTNSTLAGALVGAKLHVPVAHVEAGLRAFDKRIPEEINRIVADHVSKLLFAPNDNAASNLAREGITRGVIVAGDVMIDLALRVVADLPERPAILDRFGVQPRRYGVVTIHRPWNADDPEAFRRILSGLRRIAMPLVFPVHPRTRLMVGTNNVGKGDNIIVCEPLPYLQMIALMARSAAILTDSGGMQKEAFVLHVPCVTFRQETEWPETVESGWNVLVGSEPDAIARGPRRLASLDPPSDHGGGAASAMVEALLDAESTRSNSVAKAAAKSRVVNTAGGISVS